MKAWTLVETGKKNKYVHSGSLKRTQLCHPVLYHILELHNDGKDVGSWFNALEDSTQIENCGQFAKKEIGYYFQKYLLLKENRYFNDIDQGKRLSATIEAATVKEGLANAKQVTFEITDRCNLSCEYCAYGKFYSDFDRRENKDLDSGTAKRLLNDLLDLWNSPLNQSHGRNIFLSFYGGEPLMNFPFIAEMVDYAKNLNLLHNHFSFSMTTNGLLLEKYMDFLVENDIYLLISLDGNEENNGYRVFKNGKPAYAEIMRNVNALRAKYPDYFLNNVNFNAVLHNKNSVSDVHRFFKEHFDKVPSIAALNTSGISEAQKKEFWETYSNVTESLYKSEDYSMIEKEMFVNLPSVQNAMIFLHQNCDFCFSDYNDLIYNAREQKRTPTGTCLPFSKKVFVTVKGKILPCERIGQQHGLGQVTADRVELDYAQIAEKYNSYYEKLRKQCNVCRNSEACQQCIFNLDDIDTENPVCNGFMNDSYRAKDVSSYLCRFEGKPDTFTKIFKEVVVD